MCGIVGHLGSLNSIGVVLDGLEALEYRGYDSAGLSLIGRDKKINTFKKEGRLKNLRKEVSELNEDFSAGIGHTRWATHGLVNQINSHPHNGNGFSIVHNGIIENATELKNDLVNEGYCFSSETDSEVFVHLLEKILKSEPCFKKAIYLAFDLIRGNNCIVVLHQSECKIYAIKNNAPLACGQTNDGGNYFVSSDPYALQKHIDTIYFPENNILAVLSLDEEMLFIDSNLKETNKFKSEKNILLSTNSSKGEFEHYMLKEIWEQPDLIEQYKKVPLGEFLTEVPQNISIVACGTAYYAGLFAKNIIESRCRIPTAVSMASEFRYSNPVVGKNDLAVFISQSGETADTLAALQLCKEKGVPTLSILNVAHSTIYRESDFNLMINAGVEIGVASTKAFTLQCLTSIYFSDRLLSLKGGKSDISVLNKQSSLLSQKISQILSRTKEIKEIAEAIHSKSGFFFTGRNKNFPIALEGALKLKEIAYVHAEGYASGELKHGPIAMIDEGVVNIAYIDDHLFEKTLSNIQEIKTRKGVILAIGSTELPELKDISDLRFSIDVSDLGDFSPLALNVFGQLLSYYIAKHKGTDIDKPRNLAKSVTVE
jgi:glutamine---fructose-6-phosphate transaminase (isomerizing)